MLYTLSHFNTQDEHLEGVKHCKLINGTFTGMYRYGELTLAVLLIPLEFRRILAPRQASALR